jgi:hypothetical protein
VIQCDLKKKSFCRNTGTTYGSPNNNNIKSTLEVSLHLLLLVKSACVVACAASCLALCLSLSLKVQFSSMTSQYNITMLMHNRIKGRVGVEHVFKPSVLLSAGVFFFKCISKRIVSGLNSATASMTNNLSLVRKVAIVS